MNVIVVHSEELVKELEHSRNEIKFVVNSYRNAETRGKISIKEFDTQQEKQAYLQGIEDGEGWARNYVIENNEEVEEIVSLLKPSRVYVVREDFYQEDMSPECRFRLFAGANSYERAIFFLSETANAGDTFQQFLEKEGDFREKNLYWEIEEQTLEMWSAESLDLLKSVQELGRYAEKYSGLSYQEREVDYGVRGYYFEKASV